MDPEFTSVPPAAASVVHGNRVYRTSLSLRRLCTRVVGIVRLIISLPVRFTALPFPCRSSNSDLPVYPGGGASCLPLFFSPRELGFPSVITQPSQCFTEKRAYCSRRKNWSNDILSFFFLFLDPCLRICMPSFRCELQEEEVNGSPSSS